MLACQLSCPLAASEAAEAENGTAKKTVCCASLATGNIPDACAELQSQDSGPDSRAPEATCDAASLQRKSLTCALLSDQMGIGPISHVQPIFLRITFSIGPQSLV